MKTETHKYEELTADMRPQDPQMDGTGMTFQTLEHGGEYPDCMPQAIRMIDASGRWCTYVPITVSGKVVQSHGFSLEIDSRPTEDTP